MIDEEDQGEEERRLFEAAESAGFEDPEEVPEVQPVNPFPPLLEPPEEPARGSVPARAVRRARIHDVRKRVLRRFDSIKSKPRRFLYFRCRSCKSEWISNRSSQLAVPGEDCRCGDWVEPMVTY